MSPFLAVVVGNVDGDLADDLRSLNNPFKFNGDDGGFGKREQFSGLRRMSCSLFEVVARADEIQVIAPAAILEDDGPRSFITQRYVQFPSPLPLPTMLKWSGVWQKFSSPTPTLYSTDYMSVPTLLV